MSNSEDGSVDAQVEKGFALFEMGRAETALDIASQALADHPGHFEARRLRAYTLQSVGRSQEAYAATSDLLAERGEDFQLWYNFALICTSLEDAPGLSRAGGEMLRIDPSSPLGHFCLAALTSVDKDGRTDYTKAIAHARQAVALDPEDTGYLMRLGWILDCAGQGEEAEQAYQAVLRINPDHTSALLALAKLREGTPEAVRPLLGAARSDPRQGDEVRDSLDELLASGVAGLFSMLAFCLFFFALPFRIGMGGAVGRLLAGGLTIGVVALGVPFMVRLVRQLKPHHLTGFAKRRPASAWGALCGVTAWFAMIVLIAIPGDGQGPVEVALFAIIVLAALAYGLGWIVIRIAGRRKAST